MNTIKDKKGQPVKPGDKVRNQKGQVFDVVRANTGHLVGIGSNGSAIVIKEHQRKIEKI